MGDERSDGGSDDRTGPARAGSGAVAGAVTGAVAGAVTGAVSRGGTGPRWAVIGIFLMLLVAGLSYAQAFLTPVVLAVLLQLVFSPVRRQLERLGVPSVVSAMIIVGVLLAALGAGVASLAVPASDWAERAPTIGRELRGKVSELRGVTQGMQDAAEQIDEITKGEEDPEVQRVKVEDEGRALSIAMSLPAMAAQVLFTLILLFFLLSSGDMFYEKIVYVLPTFRDKRTAIRIARDIERKLSRYLFTITAINGCLGLAVGVGMWWLGMPNPALLGLLAFLLNYIPYVGALLGILATLVVGFVSLDTMEQAVLPALVYFGLTSLEGQLITPYFVGRSLRLNTVVVFLCVTLFAWLWSVVGMLVATPLLVGIRTFCEHIPSLERVGHFLSARGAESEAPPEDAKRRP